MNQQLTMARQTARVGEAEDVLLVADMADLLSEAGYETRTIAEALAALIPTQGNVGPYDRLKEILDVTRAYTPEFLVWARKLKGVPWHSLREPARLWRNGEVEREEVESFVRKFVERRGKWPRVDDMRRRFNLAPGHKGPGDQPGQGTLGNGEPGSALAQEVREAVQRIKEADPGAYSGFVTDAAVRAVAERHELRPVEAVRIYRQFYPASSVGLGIPAGARQPTDEAKALA